jgi:flagellar biosynthesis/type III secretory pathway M-ring protein FliF/YscJ
VKAKAVPLTKNRHVLIPIAIGLILALLIGLILFFLLKRRRRREDEDEQGKAGPGASPMIPGQRASNDQAVRN